MDKMDKVYALHRRMSQSRYAVSQKTLLEELACSPATFHRIRGYLADVLGAPLIFDRRYKGYRYDLQDTDRFELPGIWFTPAEIEALLDIQNAVQSIQRNYLAELFEPIASRCTELLSRQGLKPAAFSERIRIIPSNAAQVDDTLFRTCVNAVLTRRCLQIRHRALDNRISDRVVSPLALVRYRDCWYLDCWCHLRAALRTFALHRIEQVAAVRGPFHNVDLRARIAFFSAGYGIFNGTAPHVAHLRFCGPAASDAASRHWHQDQKATWSEDGRCLELHLPYGDDRELLRDILAWGGDVEVVGPPALRKRVQQTIAKMARIYEKED